MIGMVRVVARCPRCGVVTLPEAAETHCTDPTLPRWRGPFDGTYPVAAERTSRIGEPVRVEGPEVRHDPATG